MSELINDAEFREGLTDPKDIGAYALLVERLGQRVGDVHPRLSSEDERRTYGDQHAAELTYGQIVAREASDSLVLLPVRAQPYTGDARSRLTLAQRHLDRIEEQLTYGFSSRNRRGNLAGYRAVELQDKYGQRWLSPNVEGYDWYRGLEVSIGEDSSVIILEPWMQPWYEGGAPFPALYCTGNPDPEHVREIVAAYCGE